MAETRHLYVAVQHLCHPWLIYSLQKLIQYSIRVYLLLHNAATTSRFVRQPTRAPWNIELVKRLESTASGISFTRLLFFHPKR